MPPTGAEPRATGTIADLLLGVRVGKQMSVGNAHGDLKCLWMFVAISHETLP